MDRCAHGNTKEKGLAGRYLDLDVPAAPSAPEPAIRNLVPAKTGRLKEKGMAVEVPGLKLNDGTTVPAVGFGTYPLNGAGGVQAIRSALAL